MDFSAWELKFYEFIDKLPFDLALYHPHVVHFAVVLPLLSFLFQWFALVSPDKGYQATSNSLFTLGALFIILAFLTGKATTQDIKPVLSIAGQDLFDTHEMVGGYLALAYTILIFFKLSSSMLKGEGSRYFVTIMMIAALIGLLYEINTGHKLVYDYGAGTQMEYAR